MQGSYMHVTILRIKEDVASAKAAVRQPPLARIRLISGEVRLDRLTRSAPSRCVTLLAAEMRYKLLLNEKKALDKKAKPDEPEGDGPTAPAEEAKPKRKRKAKDNEEETKETAAEKKKRAKKEKNK